MTANKDNDRLGTEIQTINRRVGEIRRESKNLIAALKTLGEAGVDSVRDELITLEEERGQLQSKLDSLIALRDAVSHIGDLERKFFESWQGVGELLAVASPD